MERDAIVKALFAIQEEVRSLAETGSKDPVGEWLTREGFDPGVAKAFSRDETTVDSLIRLFLPCGGRTTEIVQSAMAVQIAGVAAGWRLAHECSPALQS